MVSRTARSPEVLAIPVREDVRTPFHIDLRAVIGGTIVALGVWAMLLALGLAVGLTSIDPDDASSLRGSGIFTGIWGLVAPIAALFVGAVVAARASGPMNRTGAAVHGAIVWGLTTVLAVWMLGRLTSAVVGGAMDAGRTAVEAGAELAPSVGEASAAARTVGIDADSARARANQTADEVQRGVLQAAESTGKALWFMFGALLLGLVAAVFGGLLGLTRTQLRYGRRAMTADGRVESVPRAGVTADHESSEDLRRDIAELREELREAIGTSGPH